MAETKTHVQEPAAGSAPPTKFPNGTQPQQKRGPSIHQIYALPAPIRTFPLPAFYPNNPVSLFHVAYAWVKQTLSPPPAEPSIIHHGVWSEATTSVHITDEKAVRALWEQGFYGKGSLSRSEPNWLKREQVRRGLEQAHVSEILTVQRREERAQAKWERARLEQEAIRQTKLEEARLAESRRLAKLDVSAVPTPEIPTALKLDVSATPTPEIPAAPKLDVSAVPTLETPTTLPAPVGPLELLALPNSARDVVAKSKTTNVVVANPVGPLELLALPNSARDLAAKSKTTSVGVTKPPVAEQKMTNGLSKSQNSNPDKELTGLESPPASLSDVEPLSLEPLEKKANGTHVNGILANVDEQYTNSTSLAASPAPSDSTEARTLKRQKSVRFSPNVESTTFQLLDPPSPTLSLATAKLDKVANGHAIHDSSKATKSSKNDPVVEAIVNKEHLQIMPVEALWLSYGLGALTVTDPKTDEALSSKDMLTLFRQHSHFPPRLGPDDPDLEPDDAFLLDYAVYHHFRSLGWTPRAGIKFGVDWLLYTRGPVFDHAEFGLIIIPSYSDPWWKRSGKQGPEKTWRWLHSIVRVLSHVTKSLVLVYVDIPPPPKFDSAMETGLTEVLKLYTIREVLVKRWSSNRNR